MNNEKKLILLRWALESYIYSRKPHRAQPTHTMVADDLNTILVLASRRNLIAQRYVESMQYSTDESVEEQIVEKLQAIGKKYGWAYGSADNGLTGVYIVEHASVHTEIQIPIGA